MTRPAFLLSVSALLFTGCTALVGCAAPWPPAATSGGSPHAVSPAEARIVGTHAHLFHSDRVGDRFLIHVALPIAESAGPLPAVYVLDGNASFSLVAETARLLMQGGELPPLIVVGIGYDATDAGVLEELRARDFLKSGGMRRLAAFIEDELKPFIASRYAVDERSSTLVGEATSGLFALSTLFQTPAAFDRYVIGSPPLWQNDGALFEREAEFATSGPTLKARVFLAVGGMEDNTADVERLTRLLRSRAYPQLALETVIFHGETHYSVVPAIFSRGLRFVFRDAALSGVR